LLFNLSIHRVFARTLRAAVALLVLSPFFLAPRASAQQTYVGQFDLYGGFTYLDSPNINLQQRGFHFQAGYNPRTWLALGFDYSRLTCNTDSKPNQLTTALESQIAGNVVQLVEAGLLPPNYSLVVPFDATTETFAAGPQLMIRHWKPVTLFVRPSIGAIHEVATLHATDPIAAGFVAQLAPSGQKTDWTGFYGFGGGAEFNIGDHFSIRMQADYVHNHLFSDVLKNGRNTVRLSIGPAFHLGRNIVK
jgi:Outer membrane protein beta-barrel domain